VLERTPGVPHGPRLFFKQCAGGRPNEGRRHGGALRFGERMGIRTMYPLWRQGHRMLAMWVMGLVVSVISSS
jgi:hypothetical protein